MARMKTDGTIDPAGFDPGLDFRVSRLERKPNPDIHDIIQYADAMIKDQEQRIAELEAQLAGWKQNAAFYKSCALSGEVPNEGSEPYKKQLPPNGEE